MANLSVNLCGVQFKNPVIAASGTYGFGREFQELYDIGKIGGISTKGMTLEPRLGNPVPRIAESRGVILNAVGLQNPGVEHFIENDLEWLKSTGTCVIANVAGKTLEDYEKLAQIANDNLIKALEVNVSCPNVKSGCLEFGLNPNSLFELVKKVRNKFDGFLIVKLSPNTADIKALATAVESAGADCISAINTVRGLGVKVDYVADKFITQSVQGGLSGSCIKPIALYMVSQIRQAVKIPIIAMGGIEKLSDLFEFIYAGADAFQIGTANFINPSICSTLAKELSEFMDKNGFDNFNDLKKAVKNE